jgi:hypothetical protein
MPTLLCGFMTVFLGSWIVCITGIPGGKPGSPQLAWPSNRVELEPSLVEPEPSLEPRAISPPLLRALPSSVLLSLSPGDGDLSPSNGSFDIRHHRGPSGAGTWVVCSAICLCRRRRPRAQARLRAEERTRSWPYTTAEWLHYIELPRRLTRWN